MANTINVSGQIVVTNSNLRNIATLSTALTTTGSNTIANVMNVTTGSWAVISQGSNADFRWGYFCNCDATSSVAIAVNSSASVASYLQPLDWCVLTYSGSPALYASGSGASGTILLQYVLSEK
jgi:hypothetical protein